MKNNYAFIDGQNVYMATAKKHSNPWKIDLTRFRVYLKEKYHVEKAYYFLGYVQEKNQTLYEQIQEAGFILVFREHNPVMIGTKKGNVDSDIIFQVMKRIYKKENFGKIVLVSGDGDYKQLVDFLIEEDRFGKIIFPDQHRASSLYKKISTQFWANLDNIDVMRKIGNEKGSLGSQPFGT